MVIEGFEPDLNAKPEPLRKPMPPQQNRGRPPVGRDSVAHNKHQPVTKKPMSHQSPSAGNGQSRKPSSSR